MRPCSGLGTPPKPAATKATTAYKAPARQQVSPAAHKPSQAPAGGGVPKAAAPNQNAEIKKLQEQVQWVNNYISQIKYINFGKCFNFKIQTLHDFNTTLVTVTLRKYFHRGF